MITCGAFVATQGGRVGNAPPCSLSQSIGSCPSLGPMSWAHSRPFSGAGKLPPHSIVSLSHTRVSTLDCLPLMGSLEGIDLCKSLKCFQHPSLPSPCPMNDLAPRRGWTTSLALEACGCDITNTTPPPPHPPPVMDALFCANGEESAQGRLGGDWP